MAASPTWAYDLAAWGAAHDDTVFHHFHRGNKLIHVHSRCLGFDCGKYLIHVADAIGVFKAKRTLLFGLRFQYAAEPEANLGYLFATR